MRTADLSPSIFDPRLYEAVRRPLAEAHTLPAWCYTSPEFYAREVERIFMKEWNFIGRADRIPHPGDYFTVDLVGVGMIVVRDRAGRVRAFANSCRHRGTQLVAGDGNCRAFKCPYHAWVYSLEGDLLGTTEMDHTSGFDPAQYGLVPIALDTWGGFLFVNFDPGSKSLPDYLGDLPQTLESYRFEDMVCVRRKEYDVRCNWKVHVENAMEALHIPTVHKATISRQKGQITPPLIGRGEWSALYRKHEGTRALLQGETGFPRIETLTGGAAEGSYFVLINPSTMLGCTTDCMWYIELQPLGATDTRVIIGSCFPRTTVARADFDEVVQKYYRRWDISIPEDNDISELQQKGLASPLAREGRFSHLEPLVHSIDNWVLDRVLDAGPHGREQS